MLMCAHMCVYMCVCVTKFSHIYIKKMLNMWVEKKKKKEKKARPSNAGEALANA